jgi:predicted NBD/HSP70 family sugar kinase
MSRTSSNGAAQRGLGTAALISPGMPGEVNRARVLRTLYERGPLSRAELARLTGVSRPAMSTIVRSLVEEGVLKEGNARPSGTVGGKPARPLWFSPEAPPILGACLLPGSVEAALVSANGSVLAISHRTFPADAADGTPATDSMLHVVGELMPAGAPRPMGVGIAVGGMVDTDTGTIVRMALSPGVDGLPLGSRVREAVGLPTWVDLDTRAQALGDRWFGQGRGCGTFASLYTGAALGVGLVTDGVVHRGRSGSGGEIGHTTVQVDGRPCWCGRTGCWETIATTTWLRDEAKRLGIPGASSISAGPLSELVNRAIPGAAELWDRYARNLSVGLVNLHQVFAPGLFILHGDTLAAGEAFRERIEHHLREAVPPHPAGPPRVVFTTLDDRASLLGAAGLVLSFSLRISQAR